MGQPKCPGMRHFLKGAHSPAVCDDQSQNRWLSPHASGRTQSKAVSKPSKASVIISREASFGVRHVVAPLSVALFLSSSKRQQADVRIGDCNISALRAIPALLLLLPARLFEIANPEWRLLDWVHATAVVTLTLLFIWSAGGGPWLRHFAFPVAFIFVAVPWPTVVEVPIIQGLMRVVASVAAETAMLLGIPAQVEGNLIRVTNGLVGVNEACSGIRSLQTSLMIGLLFGELKRLSVLRRITLIGGAILIALLANLVRAVFLVVVAGTKDISEVSRWHDIAGYTIIVLVFVGTMGIA